MAHLSWNPSLLSLSGLICLPEHTGLGKRLYFVADLDEKGLYSMETDLISWSEAYYVRMPKLAAESEKKTFATLNLDEVEKWQSQGYLLPKPGALTEPDRQQSNSQEDGQISQHSFSDYLPTKDDFESAYRMRCSPGQNIDIDSILDQINGNAIKSGYNLKENWRPITEINIRNWIKK